MKSIFKAVEEIHERLAEMFEIEPTPDDVKAPAHYMIGGVETKEIIKIMLTPEEYRGYCKGNIIKYRERAQFKGNAEKDYAKAREYMAWLDEVE